MSKKKRVSNSDELVREGPLVPAPSELEVSAEDSTSAEDLSEERLREGYESRRPLYDRMSEEVMFILGRTVEQEIKLHSLTPRVKDVQSFVEKVDRKRYLDPFNEAEDVVGVRIVCLFLSDLVRIREILQTEFVVLKEDDTVEGQDDRQFGYMSVHYIIKLRDDYVGPRYDALKGLVAEIQVRTILMDAWANVSHYLDYKGETSIPSALRRDFYALSGLFYVADKHFETFIEETVRSREMARGELEATPNLDVELNLDTMLAYLRQSFPNRVKAESSYVSDLVEELGDMGFATLRDVDVAVTAAEPAFLAYEADHPPPRFSDEDEGEASRFSDVGVIRISLAIVDPEYRKRKHPRNVWMSSYEGLLAN